MEQQKEKNILKNENIRDPWDNKKHTNINIKENGTEGLFQEIIAENFPNLVKETNIQGQESQKNPKQDEQKENHTKIHYG